MAKDLPLTASYLDLGAVHLERSNAPRLLTVDEPLPPDADLFLNGALDRLREPGGLPRLLLVTAEGDLRDAGLVAVVLGRVAAGRGMQVLLVDLSVGAPVLAKPFPYQPEEGFVDMVLWGSSFPVVLRKTRNERLRVVCAGSPPPDPDALFEDPGCDAVLGTLRGESELVVAVAALRNGRGEPSPVLRKADRTLLVRESGAGRPDLGDAVPPDRLAVLVLEEEVPAGRAAPVRAAGSGSGKKGAAAKPAEKPAERLEEGPVPRGAARKRVPLVRLGLLAALSIAFGIVFSNMYISHREEATRRRVEMARRPQESRPAPETGPSRTATEEGAAPAGQGSSASLIGEGAGGSPAAPVQAAAPIVSGAEAPSPGETRVSEAPPAATPAAGAAQAPAIAAAQAPAAGETRAPAPDKPAAARTRRAASGIPGGPYAVHVESFPTRADAELGAKRFRESGETVIIVEKEIPEKGTWYRILLGGFPSSEEAAAYAEEIKETFGLSYALVMRAAP